MDRTPQTNHERIGTLERRLTANCHDFAALKDTCDRQLANTLEASNRLMEAVATVELEQQRQKFWVGVSLVVSAIALVLQVLGRQ